MNPLQSKAEALREKMRSGELALGAHVFFQDPAITETFGYMGMDYVWIDGEHCAFDQSTILNHVVGAFAGNTASIVRVAWNDPVLLKPVLEMGVDGVILPMVCTKEETEAAMQACLYPPKGVRGFGPRRANQYGALSNEVYLENVEKSFLRLVQIEHKTAIENLEEIISVPELDAIIIGPNDLSASYGYLGQVTHPFMEEIYDKAAEICKSAGKPFGVSVGPSDKDFIARFIARGVSLISCVDDISSLNVACRDMQGFIQGLPTGK